MKNLSFLLLFLISLNGYTQCPAGNVNLLTQTDVDNFQDTYPNCMNLSGSLTIGGINSDITDLSPLSNLEYIGGLVIISTNITSLTGLENLQAITTGSLSILGNTNLTDVQALNHTIWMPELTIISNSNLSQCNAQAICDQVNATNTTITGNNYLCSSQAEVDLTCGFPTTQLISNDCGAQMNTFDQVFYANTISGATEYEFEFTDTDPPYNVITVQTSNPETTLQNAGLLNINKTYAVKVRAKLNGIWIFYGQGCQVHSPNTIPATQITSSNCGMVVSSFGELFYCDPVLGATQYEFEFTNTQTSNVTVSISAINSHSLQAAGLNDYNQTYDVRVRAYNNGTWGAYGAACEIHSISAICPPGNVSFYTQAEVDNFIIQFPTCTEINGHLVAQGSSVTDLTPLLNIEQIHGALALYQTGLTNLSGLESLHTITSPHSPGLDIQLNNNLQSISQLSNLTSINQGITIGWSPNLTSLQGLEGLTSIPGLVQLSDNGNADMTGFNNITTLEGLHIHQSDIITLNGLENLTSITNGDLSIGGNSQLNDIHALDHPISISQNLLIGDNPNLSQCNALAVCDYISSNTATIQTNNYGCNSQAEVQTSCEVPFTKLKDVHCGEQLSTFNEVFYADPVPGATEYEFLFIDVDNIISPVYSLWNGPAHYLQIPGLLTIDKTYNVQVRAKVNGVWGLFGTVCQIHSPNTVPTTQLKPAHCGEQLSTFNEVFYADALSGATQYEFLFVDVDNIIAPVYSLWSGPAHYLQIPNLLVPNKTYDVQVRGFVGGVWGNFGPICQIHSPVSVPLTQLKPAHCGEQLTTFNEIFKTESVSGATQYEFKFTNINTLVVTTNTWSGTSHSLQHLNLFELGQTYDVQTRAQVNGVWGDYGPICQIYSPLSVPNTKIRDIYCGITLSAYNQTFKCDHVAGADQYRFRFNGGGLVDYEQDRPNFSNNLNLAGLQTQNTTYDVDVKARINGVWGDYAVICQITSPPNPPMAPPGQGNDEDSYIIEGSNLTASFDSQNDVEISVYPNPVREQFTLSTDLKEYTIKLYLPNGQLVFSNSNLNGNQNIDVSSFDSGIYILHILNEDKTVLETKKVTIIQ